MTNPNPSPALRSLKDQYRASGTATLFTDLEFFIYELTELQETLESHPDSVEFAEQSIGYLASIIQALLDEVSRRQRLASRIPGKSLNSRHPSSRIEAEDVKRHLSLIDRVRDLGVGVTRSGKTYKALCPLPDHDERSPSFTIYDDDHWHCFGCNRSGDIFTLEMLRTGNYDFRTVLETLARHAGVARSIRATESDIDRVLNEAGLPGLEARCER